jgi:hypothetical protein
MKYYANGRNIAYELYYILWLFSIRSGTLPAFAAGISLHFESCIWIVVIIELASYLHGVTHFACDRSM